MKTRGLSILEYNREMDKLEADNKQLRSALELAKDELTGEAWLAADLALSASAQTRQQTGIARN